MSSLDALFASWRFPFFPIFLAGLTAAVYLRGFLKLSHILPQRFPSWRLWCFLGGLFAIFLAIASPLDAFAGLLLQAHMVQHLLLTMVAPPLLLLGAPMLPLLRGLPRTLAREGLGPFLIWPPLQKLGKFLVHPVPAWLIYQGAVFVWHLPPCYEKALRSTAWHQIEHATFLGAALLFWWFVVQPWPSHSRTPRWFAIPYLLLADLANTALAAFFCFYDRVLYPTYASAPRLWNVTALEDQMAAGAIMWVPGSVIYLIPVGIVCLSLLQGRRGVRPSDLLKPKLAAVSQVRPARRLSWKWLAWAPGWIRWALLVLSIIVIVDGFAGPKLSPLNLAGVLPWTYWRGFDVLALLAVGNLFCMACPFVLVRDLFRRVLPADRPWPAYLRNKWMAVLLLFLFLWIYEAYSLWDRPVWTAVVILVYFAGAVVVDGIFRGASFCKYVCPLGQYHFVLSLVSPAQVRVKEHDRCLSCKTYDCIRGNAQQRGCELRLFQPRKSGNADCTMCLDCVKACPHDNVSLQLSSPVRDWTNSGPRSGVGPFAARLDLACLILLITFGAFFNAGGMIAPVQNWEAAVLEQIGEQWRPALVFLMAAVVLIGLPAALAWGCASLSRWWSGGAAEASLQATLSRFAPAFAPLAASMWGAHLLFHLFTGAFTLAPALTRAAPAVSAAGFSGAWIQGLELLLLDAGLLFSSLGFWKLAKRPGAPSGVTFRSAAPWILLALLLWVLGVWILFQPMQMRGTMSAVGH